MLHLVVECAIGHHFPGGTSQPECSFNPDTRTSPEEEEEIEEKNFYFPSKKHPSSSKQSEKLERGAATEKLAWSKGGLEQQEEPVMNIVSGEPLGRLFKKNKNLDFFCIFDFQ
jgi:hypothetical protein